MNEKRGEDVSQIIKRARKNERTSVGILKTERKEPGPYPDCGVKFDVESDQQISRLSRVEGARRSGDRGGAAPSMDCRVHALRHTPFFYFACGEGGMAIDRERSVAGMA